MAEKSDAEHPAWLKRMQNGTIGEARSRAFLIDRFWVLERSVDIDGADLIIQRRITTQNLLDREAPRLGVVQVKFYGTTNTSQYVHKEYVIGRDEEVRSEFFLLCHTGEEEHQRLFLLTAEEIQKNFTLKDHDGSEKFYLPHDKVVESGKFEVQSKKLSLDRIENQLKLADFTKNRHFLSWVLPSTSSEVDAILPEFKEPISNNWGSIPQGFVELKETARTALIDVEEVYNLILKVADATDPTEAEKTVEKMAYYCRSGRGWSITLPDFNNYDFFEIARRHKTMVTNLKNDGLLDTFIALPKTLQDKVTAFLKSHLPVSSDAVLKCVVKYDVGSFNMETVDCSIVYEAEYSTLNASEEFLRGDSPFSAWPKMSVVAQGQVQMLWKIGKQKYVSLNSPEGLEKFERDSIDVFEDCASFMHDTKYPESKK